MAVGHRAVPHCRPTDVVRTWNVTMRTRSLRLVAAVAAATILSGCVQFGSGRGQPFPEEHAGSESEHGDDEMVESDGMSGESDGMDE